MSSNTNNKRMTVDIQALALKFIETRSEKDFQALYLRLLPGLRKKVMEFHRDRDIISEVLAITFSKIYTEVDKYSETWKFSTWAYTIAKNEALLEFLKDNGKNKNSLCNMIDSGVKINFHPSYSEGEDPKYDLGKDEKLVADENSSAKYSQVIKEIYSLPDETRRIFIMKTLEDYKFKEIAKELNISESDIKNRYYTARQMIREKVNNDNKSLKNSLF